MDTDNYWITTNVDLLRNCQEGADEYRVECSNNTPTDKELGRLETVDWKKMSIIESSDPQEQSWISNLKRHIRTVRDWVFRNPGYIAGGFILTTPLVVGGVNFFETPSIYQNLMLAVGWIQAVITGYLSFKIFSVSKRDSELPELRFKLVNVEEIETPHENHMVVRVVAQLANTTFGRAKITDINLSPVWDENELERRKTPGEGNILAGFPRGKGVPTIIDKGNRFSFQFQINGFSYLDELTLEVEEETLGKLKHAIMLSDISFELASKSRAEEREYSDNSH